MKNINIIITVLFLLPLTIMSQPINNQLGDVVMPTPEVAALGKYGDIPVGHYTGVPSISVPLHVVTSGPISVPIALNYHSSGIKVAERASWVGLGWSLSCQYMISRTVLGIPDDIEGAGYYYAGNSVNYDLQFLIDANDGWKDTEPDIFSYNIPGFSGKFFFDGSQNVHFIPEADIDVEVTTTSSSFTSITLITTDGTRYFFGDTENTIINGTSSNYTSSWKISNISSADGNSRVDFEYNSESYNLINPASCSYTKKADCSGIFGGSIDCLGPEGLPIIETVIFGKRLSKISTFPPTDIAEFTSDDRLDLSGSELLESIKVHQGTSPDEYCILYNLEHSYWEDPFCPAGLTYDCKRLRLDKVKTFACSTPVTKESEYSFEYEEKFGNPNFLPYLFSKAVDHWGYYNGQENNNLNSLNVPSTTVVNSLATVTFGNSNRESNPQVAKYGTLKKINYPTGGYTRFVYESNTISKQIVNKNVTSLIANLQNPECSTSPCCTDDSQKQEVDLSQPLEEYYFDMEIIAVTACSGPPEVNINVYHAGNFIGAYTMVWSQQPWANVLSEIPLSEFPISFVQGESYKFEVEGRECIGIFGLNHIVQTQVAANVAVGGLRVKEVINNASQSVETEEIVSKYSYFDPANAKKSSGKLTYEPTYGFRFEEGGLPSVSMILEQSIVPLRDYEGYHIAYTNVIETKPGNGWIEHEFEYEPVSGIGIDYPVGIISPRVKSGNLKKRSIYSEAGLINEDIYEDDGRPYTYPNLIMFKLFKVPFPCVSPSYVFRTTAYYPRTSVYRLGTKTSMLDGVETVTNYIYSADTEHPILLPTETIFENSNGDEIKTKTVYSYNTGVQCLRDELRERNMTGIPIQTETWVNGQQVGGSQTVFSNYDHSNGTPEAGCTGNAGNPDFPYPWKFFNYEVELDVNNNPVGPGIWIEKGVVNERFPSNGKPKTFTQEGWLPEQYTWDPANNLIKTRSYDAFTWSYDYYPGTKLISKITGIDGQESEFDYDGLMRLQLASARGGAVSKGYVYQYGQPNKVTSTTTFTDDTPSQINEQVLDGLGRPIKTTVNGVVKNEVGYDGQGRVSKQTYLPGNFTTFVYELSPLSRPIKQVFPGGSFTEKVYGSDATNTYYKLTIKDEDGKEASVLTDKLGRTYKTIDALGGETINTYDDKNNLVKVVTPMGDTPLYNYTYQYDARNRLKQKTIPGTIGNYSYTYFPNDLPESMTDPNGNLFTYVYDDYGRETSRKLGGVEIASNIYDTGGGINVGKLKQSTNHAVDGSAIFVMDYVYDSFGRVGTTTINNDLGGNDVVVNGWNNADWLESMTRTHSVSGASPFDIVQGYEYDNFGRVTKSTHSANGISTTLSENTWNDRDQLLRKVLGGGLQQLDYTYNERGWLTAINQPLGLFSGNLPLSACDQEENATTGSEVFCGTNEVGLEELNNLRFQENFLVDCYDPCAATGGLVNVEDLPCDDPQAELASVLAELEDNYTVEVTVVCEDGTVITTIQPNVSVLNFPTTLYRVRLCDGTEAYMFASGLALLTPGTYEIVQELEVASPDQVFYVNNGSKQGKEVTLEALLQMIIEGRDITVGNYMQADLPCEPEVPDCSPAEQLAQQQSLTAIMGAATELDFSQGYLYPSTLYRVLLCDGTEVYLFSFELDDLYGSYLLLQEVTITSQQNQLLVGSSLDNADLNDLFHLSLRYDDGGIFNVLLDATAQKNGNIAGMKWQVAGREAQAYGFQYDALNRLKQAKYADNKGGLQFRLNNRYTVENIQYDAIGNIQTLDRHGVMPDPLQPGCLDEGYIDKLTYAYTGNRLQSVTDAAAVPFVDKGFVPGAGSTYGYDNNGNMTSDPNKGIGITYNYLNLPHTVTKSGDGIIFSYDSAGRKYRKSVTGADTYTKDYVGGIEYKDNVLEAIYHEEGRIGKDDQGSLRYEFTIRDHLGNSRVMFTDLNGDGKIQLDDPDTPNNESELLQENHYYPFGMVMEGEWTPQIGERNQYQYNGKEIDNDLGLDWYHYGFRMYDAGIGRFTGVDPIADQFEHVSVYNYAENEPIANIDLHGLQKVSINDINSGGQVHRRDVNVSVNMKVINLSSRDDFRFNTGLRKASPLAAREFRTSFKQRIVTDPKVGLSSNEVSVNATFKLSVEQVSHLNQVSDKDHVMMIVDELDGAEGRASLGGNVGLIDASRLDLGSDGEVLLHELGHNLDFNFHDLGGDEHSADGKGLMGANINGQTDVPKEILRDMYQGLGSGAFHGQHINHENTRENARTFLKNNVKKYDETKAKTKGF